MPDPYRYHNIFFILNYFCIQYDDRSLKCSSPFLFYTKKMSDPNRYHDNFFVLNYFCIQCADRSLKCSSPFLFYSKKMPDPYRSGIFLVPLTGLEPVRILLRGILSPLCLPIPPQRHFPYKKYCNMIQYFPQEVKSYPRFFLSSVHKKRIRFPFFSKRFLESVFQPLQNCSSAFPKKCGTKAG